MVLIILKCIWMKVIDFLNHFILLLLQVFPQKHLFFRCLIGMVTVQFKSIRFEHIIVCAALNLLYDYWTKNAIMSSVLSYTRLTRMRIVSYILIHPISSSVRPKINICWWNNMIFFGGLGDAPFLLCHFSFLSLPQRSVISTVRLPDFSRTTSVLILKVCLVNWLSFLEIGWIVESLWEGGKSCALFLSPPSLLNLNFYQIPCEPFSRLLW